MSLHNFLLFHMRRHVKNSGFVLHHVMKQSPSFLTYYISTPLGHLVYLSFFLSVGEGGRGQHLFKAGDLLIFPMNRVGAYLRSSC